MKAVCEHCGGASGAVREAAGRPVYCCAGCALAARVPVDAQGQFPVNGALLAALGVGLLYFNEVLFWLPGVLAAGEGEEAAKAARFARISLGAGVATWAALVYLQVWAGARRGADWLVAGLTAGGLAVSVAAGCAGTAAAVNAALALWSVRGLRRKKPATGK